ncbi:MAG: DUF1592 domain-containing protein [Acidobacteriota bacterium]
MTRSLVVLVAVVGLGLGLSAAGPQPAPARPAPAAGARQAPVASSPRPAAGTLAPVEQAALVKQYCVTCHNDRARVGGLSLATFDAARVSDDAETAEKVIRKLRAGMMPPAGARRPEEATLKALAVSLERSVDAAAATSPNPGWKPFQRLNRAEYQRAVEELLGISVDVSSYLPPDTVSRGYDNVADVQTFSPTLMEGYLRAASQISRLAVGDRNATAGSYTYKLGRTRSQLHHVEGAPLGTRGGLSVVHVFPADGEYVFRMNLHYEPLGGLYGRSTMSYLGTEKVEVSINGERVALFELNARMSESDPKNSLDLVTPPIHVKAGPQRVSAAFLQIAQGPSDDLLIPVENTLVDVSISFGITAHPHLRDFVVTGPFKVTGISDTPSRRRIFTCRPTAAEEETPCARAILRNLATQAYRGTASDDDVQDLLRFYERGRTSGGFEGGIRLALQALLASPRFVFRFEPAPSALRAGDAYRVNDIDLASRLSFFLWGTVPDEELVKAAGAGALRTKAGLETQVRRLLADPRAESLATRFGGQWLRLQELDKIFPDYLYYPMYDDTLAEGFRREVELFVDSLFREDRSLLDLLTADHTYVNERVALHYGIPNVMGSAFQRVTVPDHRRGILGKGAILTLTSIADRTSPVLRGKWVMEVLLGTPPPPPPPNVPSLDDSVKSAVGGRTLSVRERMEEHRKNPACTSCHRVIDPLGLALENFDVTGAWRIKDNEVPVDSVGDLYDGTKMDGVAGLRNALLKHKDVVLLSFTENLMTYALGRRVEYYDMPTVRAIVRDAEKAGYRMSAFILGIVNSPAFRMNRPVEPALTTLH